MAALQPQVEGLPIAIRSFAEVMSSSAGPKTPKTSLFYTQPDSCLDPAAAQIGKHKGLPSIAFSKPHVQQISSSFKWVLIGKFAKGYNKDHPNLGRPAVEDLKKYFDSLDFRGSYQIGLLDNRHLLIQFKLQEDFLHMYSRAVWRIKGISMRILKWSPDFHVDREIPVAPVWVGFPRLPIQYFEPKTVFAIAGLIGAPLCIDSATATLKRPSIARVQVDVDLLKDQPNQIWISVEGENGFWQQVEYERIPEYCHHCWHIGHSDSHCHVRCPQLKMPRKNNTVQNSEPMPSQTVANSADVLTGPSVAALISGPAIDQGMLQPAASRPQQLSQSVDTIAEIAATIPPNAQSTDVPSGSAPAGVLNSLGVQNFVDQVPAVSQTMSHLVLSSALEQPLVEGLASATAISDTQTNSVSTVPPKSLSTVPVAAVFQSVLGALNEQEVSVAQTVSNSENRQELRPADCVPPELQVVGVETTVVEVVPSSEEDQAFVVKDANRFSVLENLDVNMQQDQPRQELNQDLQTKETTVDASELAVVAEALPMVPLTLNNGENSQRELVVMLPPIIPDSEGDNVRSGVPLNQLARSWNVDAASYYPANVDSTRSLPLSISNATEFPQYQENDDNDSNESDGAEDTDKDSYEDFLDSQSVRDDLFLQKRKHRRVRCERDAVHFRGRGRPLGSRNRTYFDVQRTMNTRSRTLD